MNLSIDFAERGYRGPIPVLDRATAHRFLEEVTRLVRQAPLDWHKGWAAVSRPYYALGCHPVILGQVTELLGSDFLLWGAKLVIRTPGEVHAWHTDLECSAPDGRTVTVWLGLRNCSHGSSLQVVPGSHRFGETVQEVRVSHGLDRATSGQDDVLQWARARDPESRIETVAARDGEAVLFDGRLWHGSDNRAGATRATLLLQYATPDTPIRIPTNYEWPYETLERPLPPCVLISGEDHHHVNRIVPGPAASGAERGPQLTSRARALTLPLSPDPQPWKPYPIFHGTTAGQRSLTCHLSALVRGHSPHPPHRHDEEELLMVFAGEADIILPELSDREQRQRLRAGECVYYPAQFPHTIEGVSDAPVNYLMFKWVSDPTGTEAPLGFGRYSFARRGGIRESGFHTDRLFEGPTRWLHKIHCHLSTMAPGAGYEPHVDGYDVAMIILEGELESLGQRLSPHGVYFYAAGEPHGARNPGLEVARYVVFEFHAQPTVPSDNPPHVPLIRKLADPRRWRRKLGSILRRIRALIPAAFQRGPNG